MSRIIEFLFFRWKWEVMKQGSEKWENRNYITGLPMGEPFYRNFIDYKLTNKFDGSVKIKRKYLNK